MGASTTMIESSGNRNMTEELYQTNPYLKTCEARVVSADERGIVLDQTVFYAAGGGQPGDTGVLRHPDGTSITVIDTRRDRESGEIMHISGDISGADAPSPEPGQTVTAELDWERRHRLMRMHSCLHLMCAVIDAGVTGGQVHDGRGRLDFDLPETLDKEEVTARLNELSSRSTGVDCGPTAVPVTAGADMSIESRVAIRFSVSTTISCWPLS